MTRGQRQPSAALALLRESQDRVLEREGIPMFLALVDERPGRELPAGVSADGRAVADAVEALRAEVAPRQRPGDMGVVIEVLQAAAYRDLNQP